MYRTKKCFDWPKTAVQFLRYGIADASIFLLYSWIRWLERHKKSLKVLGGPFANPRERIISALWSVKEIVSRPRLLVSGGISLGKEGELPLDGWIIWIKPKCLHEDLITFVHECWHALLYRNGLRKRWHHNESLIEMHSEIAVSMFEGVILDELAFSCGGYQLWFDGFADAFCSFWMGRVNNRADNWFYDRTGTFPDRRDDSLEIHYLVQRRNAK